MHVRSMPIRQSARASTWRVPLAIAGLALLICVRMPDVIIAGRFWAEEGRIFFARAWVMPAWDAVWAPYGGYLNLVANVATLGARAVMPLRWAPYLTISVGLLFQLLPPLLVLTARDSWLRPFVVRMLAALLLVLAPATEEIWLQTLHCQFELTICCGIILALAPAVGFWRWFRIGLLFLTPLCGPGAIALLPLFALRAVLDRSADRFAQVAALGAGSAIQLAVFFAPVPGRAYAFDPWVVLSVVTLRHLAVPLLGPHTAERIKDGLRAAFAAGRVPVLDVVLPVMVFIPLLIALLRRGPGHPGVWFLAAAATQAVLANLGVIGSSVDLLDVFGNQRYMVAPQLLLELAVLSLAATASGRTALVARGAIAWMLVVGLTTYWATGSAMARGPAWRPEVAAWRADAGHALRIWPTGWMMQLQGR